MGHTVRAGDCLTFPSTLAHRWRNSGKDRLAMLWVNTPITFLSQGPPGLPRTRGKRSRAGPSGLSITSTIEGSSRNVAIAAPSAVRSMRAPREKASEWSGVTATIVPVEGQSRDATSNGDD